MSHLFQSQSALLYSPALDFRELATFSHTFAKHVLEGLNDVTLVATIGDIGGIAGQRN